MISVSEENEFVRDGLKLIGHLNLAAVFLKLKQFFMAMEECDRALLIKKNNQKALYRRAQVCTDLFYL